MKKILLAVAFVAATLGANAQTVLIDTDTWADEQQEGFSYPLDLSSFQIATELQNNYSYNQLVWMLNYSFCYMGNRGEFIFKE